MKFCFIATSKCFLPSHLANGGIFFTAVNKHGMAGFFGVSNHTVATMQHGYSGAK